MSVRLIFFWHNIAVHIAPNTSSTSRWKRAISRHDTIFFILAIFSWDTWWSITFWRSGGCFIVSHNAVFVWSKHVLLQGKFRQTSFTKTKMLHVCLLFHKLNLVVGHITVWRCTLTRLARWTKQSVWPKLKQQLNTIWEKVHFIVGRIFGNEKVF